jgi:hypothetical protein
MRRKLKTWTLIGVCTCGCEQTKVHHAEAKTAKEAADTIESLNETSVLAAFRGKLMDQYEKI